MQTNGAAQCAKCKTVFPASRGRQVYLDIVSPMFKHVVEHLKSAGQQPETAHVLNVMDHLKKRQQKKQALQASLMHPPALPCRAAARQAMQDLQRALSSKGQANVWYLSADHGYSADLMVKKGVAWLNWLTIYETPEDPLEAATHLPAIAKHQGLDFVSKMQPGDVIFMPGLESKHTLARKDTFYEKYVGKHERQLHIGVVSRQKGPMFRPLQDLCPEMYNLDDSKVHASQPYIENKTDAHWIFYPGGWVCTWV
jgi:hypothetical protein